MRVFLTGGTGFIVARLVPELIGAGHLVTALSRSEEDARALFAAGCHVHEGSIEDLESLRSGAAAAAGVIHCAFNNDFEHLAEGCDVRRAGSVRSQVRSSRLARRKRRHDMLDEPAQLGG